MSNFTPRTCLKCSRKFWAPILLLSNFNLCSPCRPTSQRKGIVGKRLTQEELDTYLRQQSRGVRISHLSLA